MALLQTGAEMRTHYRRLSIMLLACVAVVKSLANAWVRARFGFGRDYGGVSMCFVAQN